MVGSFPACCARAVVNVILNLVPPGVEAVKGSPLKKVAWMSPDGKMTREPLAESGQKNSGTWKLNAKGLLHDLATREAQLLHCHSEAREQLVSSNNCNHNRYHGGSVV